MQSFDYHLENVNNRLETLLLVLQYDSQNYKCMYKREHYFTFWERMQINKERSAMNSFIAHLFEKLPYAEINWFRVPNEIEEKITTICLLIKQQNWTPKKYEL